MTVSRHSDGRPRLRIRLVFVLVGLLGVVSCGDGDEADGATGPVIEGDLPSCCDGSQYLVCVDHEAVLRCDGGFDVAACLTGCLDDVACRDACRLSGDGPGADPGHCTRVPDRDAVCQLEDPEACAGLDLGACQRDLDCESDNCVAGRCFARAIGNPCEGDFDCDSGRCREGCCASTADGQPCEGDLDCRSFKCIGGLCSGNGTGTPCDETVDCDSRVCVEGVCG